MRLLVLAAVDIRNNADELVHFDLVHLPLQMSSQILPLKAEKFSSIKDHPDRFGQPARDCPVVIGFNGLQRGIYHEDIRNIPNGFTGRQLLVSAAFIAPATGLGLSFNACFEDLRKRRDLRT